MHSRARWRLCRGVLANLPGVQQADHVRQFDGCDVGSHLLLLERNPCHHVHGRNRLKLVALKSPGRALLRGVQHVALGESNLNGSGFEGFRHMSFEFDVKQSVLQLSTNDFNVVSKLKTPLK